jgi:hypothetical protein
MASKYKIDKDAKSRSKALRLYKYMPFDKLSYYFNFAEEYREICLFKLLDELYI